MGEPRHRQDQGVNILYGLRVKIGDGQAGVRTYQVTFEEHSRRSAAEWPVLIALHYYTHVLSRYPRDHARLDVFGMNLRQMIADIVEQGIWPGSDLFRYAGISDRVRLVDNQGGLAVREVRAMLLRTVMATDLDLALEVPVGVSEEALIDSVVAVLQATANRVPEPQIEMLDKALRYLRMYIGEGAFYASLAAAQDLANRAFREAGGEAV